MTENSNCIANTGVGVFTDGKKALDAVNAAVAAVPFGGAKAQGKPAAYLTYYFFDKNLNFKKGGLIATVSGNALSMEQFSFKDVITIEEQGYFLAYLSNESNSAGYPWRFLFPSAKFIWACRQGRILRRQNNCEVK